MSEHLGASYTWWHPNHLYDQFWPKLGVRYDGADPRFATNGGRCEHVAELDAAIAAWTRTLPAAEAEAVLEAAEVPCSRLYDMRDCAEDPHFRAREVVMEVADPLIGPVLHPAAPFRLDGVAPREMVRWTGPEAGAHNDRVFRDILGEA